MRFTEKIDFAKTVPKYIGDVTGTGLKTTYYGKLPVCYWGTYNEGTVFGFSLLPLTIPKDFKHYYCTRNANGKLVFVATNGKVDKDFQMMMLVDLRRLRFLENIAQKFEQTLAINKTYKQISTEPVHEQYEAYRMQLITDNGGIPPIKPIGPHPTPMGAKGCIGSLFDNGALHYFVYNEGAPEQYYMIPIIFPSMFIGYYRYEGDYIHKVIEIMAQFNSVTTTGVRSFPFEIAPDSLILSEPMAGIVYIDDLTYSHKNVPGSAESVQISFNDLSNAYSPAPDLS